MSNTINPIRRRAICLSAILLLALSGCSEYERSNPVDPDYKVSIEIIGPDTIKSFQTPVAYTIRSTPEYAARDLAWSATGNGLRESSPAGTFTALSNGSYTITAALHHNRATKYVIVDQRPARLAINRPATTSIDALSATLSLTAAIHDAGGSQMQGPSSTPTWSSSDPGVATVTSYGAVTAQSNGTTYIRAHAGGFADSVAITVRQKAARINFDKLLGYTIADVGESVQIIASATDSRSFHLPTGSITWTSSNPDAFPVDDNGIVTANAYGSAVITASAGDISRATTVRVTGGTAPTLDFVHAGLTTIDYSNTPEMLRVEYSITDANADLDSLFIDFYDLYGYRNSSYSGQLDQGQISYVGGYISSTQPTVRYIEIRVKDAAGNSVRSPRTPVTIQPSTNSPLLSNLTARTVSPDSLYASFSVTDYQQDANIAWIIATDHNGNYIGTGGFLLDPQTSDVFDLVLGIKASPLTSLYRTSVIISDKQGNLSVARTTTNIARGNGSYNPTQLPNTNPAATSIPLTMPITIERGNR